MRFEMTLQKEGNLFRGEFFCGGVTVLPPLDPGEPYEVEMTFWPPERTTLRTEVFAAPSFTEALKAANRSLVAWAGRAWR